jgi:hypothetical protein
MHGKGGTGTYLFMLALDFQPSAVPCTCHCDCSNCSRPDDAANRLLRSHGAPPPLKSRVSKQSMMVSSNNIYCITTHHISIRSQPKFPPNSLSLLLFAHSQFVVLALQLVLHCAFSRRIVPRLELCIFRRWEVRGMRIIGTVGARGGSKR